MRHPKFILPTFLWSHHEKMIIIDQEIGFLGGLDLCFGRMDNNDHFLKDISVFNKENNENIEFWPGMDYSNIRIRDFDEVTNHRNSLLNKKNQPRLPWHDISLKIMGNFFYF